MKFVIVNPSPVLILIPFWALISPSESYSRISVTRTPLFNLRDHISDTWSTTGNIIVTSGRLLVEIRPQFIKIFSLNGNKVLLSKTILRIIDFAKATQLISPFVNKQ